MKKSLIRWICLCLVWMLMGTLALPYATAADNVKAGAYPRTITDHLGREVVLEKRPEKLVSGYYITTSLLLALGLSDALVGVEAKAERFPIYQMAAPRILALPNVGSAKEFDLESCAALAPDLVILPIRLEESVSSLEALGITVLAVDPEDTARLLETIEMVGLATGTEARAAELSDVIAQHYAALSRQVEGLEKPTLYFAGNSAYLRTAGPKVYQHSLIEAAGAENVASALEDNYWAEISYEQLLAWNPDVIVMASGAEYSVEDIQNDVVLAGLDAVANQQILQMPDAVESWDAPVPSSVLGALWLTSALHPEAYGPEEFQRDAVAFYQDFYQVDVSDLLK